MFTSLHIIDNLLENPNEIRKEILHRGFSDNIHEGVVFEGTNPFYNPTEITEAIRRCLGPIKFKITAFRKNSAGSQLHSLVHADNTEAQFASILYLNTPEQCQGGTAFWRHKETGWEAQPTQDELDAKGKTIEWLHDEWNRAEAWEQTLLVPMKFNRFIYYPTSLFHSRYPWYSFGEKDEDSRLIWVGFFDL